MVLSHGAYWVSHSDSVAGIYLCFYVFGRQYINVYIFSVAGTENLPCWMEAYCFWGCLSVSEPVRPENLVNATSQKPMKGISPIGHMFRPIRAAV